MTRHHRLAKLEALCAAPAPSEATTFVIRRRIIAADGALLSVRERAVTLHPDGTRTVEDRS